jgi:hypothetical protein
MIRPPLDHHINVMYHELDMSPKLIAKALSLQNSQVRNVLTKRPPEYNKHLVEDLRSSYFNNKRSVKYHDVMVDASGNIYQLFQRYSDPLKYYQLPTYEGKANMIVNGKKARRMVDRIVYEAFNGPDARIVTFDYIDGNINNPSLDNITPRYEKCNKATVDLRYKAARHMDTLTPEESHALYDDELTPELVDKILTKKAYQKINVDETTKQHMLDLYTNHDYRFREMKRHFSKYKVKHLQRAYKELRDHV